MRVGYARVSTEDQKLDLQRDALTQAGVDACNIYEEHVSGVKTKRPELDHCLKALRPGDTLVVWKLDRLGRSVKELIAITERLEKNGVEFVSLRDNIDTTTAVGKVVFHILAAFAQFERDLVSERTKAGLKAARARGHRGGRKPKVTPAKLRIIKALKADPLMTMPEIAAQVRISPSAIYRALAADRVKEQAEHVKQLPDAAD